MGILNTLKTSGALPVNELNLMTTGSPFELVRELGVLQKGGLVDFDGDLPPAEAVAETHTQIRLTKAGLRESLS